MFDPEAEDLETKRIMKKIMDSLKNGTKDCLLVTVKFSRCNGNKRNLQVYDWNSKKQSSCFKASLYDHVEVRKSDNTSLEAVRRFYLDYFYYRENMFSDEGDVDLYNRIIRNGGLTAYARKLESTIDKRECL